MITGVIKAFLNGRKVIFVTNGEAQKVHTTPQIQGVYHLWYTSLVFSCLNSECAKIEVLFRTRGKALGWNHILQTEGCGGLENGDWKSEIGLLHLSFGGYGNWKS